MPTTCYGLVDELVLLKFTLPNVIGRRTRCTITTLPNFATKLTIFITHSSLLHHGTYRSYLRSHHLETFISRTSNSPPFSREGTVFVWSCLVLGAPTCRSSSPCHPPSNHHCARRVKPRCTQKQTMLWLAMHQTQERRSSASAKISKRRTHGTNNFRRLSGLGLRMTTTPPTRSMQKPWLRSPPSSRSSVRAKCRMQPPKGCCG